MNLSIFTSAIHDRVVLIALATMAGLLLLDFLTGVASAIHGRTFNHAYLAAFFANDGQKALNVVLGFILALTVAPGAYGAAVIAFAGAAAIFDYAEIASIVEKLLSMSGNNSVTPLEDVLGQLLRAIVAKLTGKAPVASIDLASRIAPREPVSEPVNDVETPTA